MCAPLFVLPNGVGHYDWDQHTFYYASVLRSVVEYGQWPFWNPWYCGGNVLWQNPQVPLLSPAYPLALVFSLPLAMKVNVVVHYWIGFVGMHLLLRQVAGVRFLPLATYLSCVFVASGALALHIAEGHAVFLPAFFLPLLLYLAVPRDVGRAACVTRCSREALLGADRDQRRSPHHSHGRHRHRDDRPDSRRDETPLAAGPRCARVRCGGVRLRRAETRPRAHLHRKRPVSGRSGVGAARCHDVEMVGHAYLDPSQNRRTQFPDQVYPWQEYGNYIGVPAALLIVAALLWVFFSTRRIGDALARRLARRRRRAVLRVLAGRIQPVRAGLARARGPFLSKYRLPSRFTIGFVLFAATLVGWALRELSFDRHQQPPGTHRRRGALPDRVRRSDLEERVALHRDLRSTPARQRLPAAEPAAGANHGPDDRSLQAGRADAAGADGRPLDVQLL